MIVGITGKKGAGKSFLFSRLKEAGRERGIKVARLPFAGALKVLASRFGVVMKKDRKALGEYEKVYGELFPFFLGDCSYESFEKGYKIAVRRLSLLTDTLPAPVKLEELYKVFLSYCLTREDKFARKFLQLLGTEYGREVVGEDVWLRCHEYGLERIEGDVVVVDDLRFPNELAYLRSKRALVVYVAGGESGDVHASEQYVEKIGSEADLKVVNTYRPEVFDPLIEEILSLI